jgi:hypothetical protein
MNDSDSSGREAQRAGRELRKLEESLLELAVRRNGDRLREMLAEDFLEFGSSGRVWTRRTIIELLAREKGFVPPAIVDFEFRLLSGDVALVTYRTVRTDAETGEHLESLRSSLWTREVGKWRMRFHQGTRTNP